MKFPLAEHPFRSVELSREQCEHYEHVTTAMLDETVAVYERFVHLENRTLDKKRWKPVKTRDHLTVYKLTDRAHDVLRATRHASAHSSPATTSRSGSSRASTQVATTVLNNMHEWQLPKLLAVGSIAGTLDDVMYGVTAPDVKSMLLRSSYVNDELVDGGVLHQMKGATTEDPFQFLGIKWYVKAHPTGINAVVSPRDSVVIDATGLRIQKNGDRIGYHVMHSVLLPECPELKHLAIMRGFLSSCYLFKQMRNGTVEVYMTSYVHPGGRLPDSVATLSVANALIGCWKSVWCSQSKKLAWLIQSRAPLRAKRKADGRVPTMTSTGKKYECELCRSAFRAYKAASGCQVCLKLVCSRCQTNRKISIVQRRLDVKQWSVVACKDCVTQAAELSAFDLAREEYLGKLVQQSLTTSATFETSDESWTLSSRSVTSNSPDRSNPTALDPSFAHSGKYHVEPAYTSSSTARTRSVGCESDSMTLYTLQQANLRASISSSHAYSPEHGSPEWKRSASSTMAMTMPVAPSYRTEVPVADLSAEVGHQQQLWMQMNKLREAAEQTYMLTKQNANAMRFSAMVE